jgi:hypothetical protein
VVEDGLVVPRRRSAVGLRRRFDRLRRELAGAARALAQM